MRALVAGAREEWRSFKDGALTVRNCVNCGEVLKGTRAQVNQNGEPVHLDCSLTTGVTRQPRNRDRSGLLPSPTTKPPPKPTMETPPLPTPARPHNGHPPVSSSSDVKPSEITRQQIERRAAIDAESEWATLREQELEKDRKSQEKRKKIVTDRERQRSKQKPLTEEQQKRSRVSSEIIPNHADQHAISRSPPRGRSRLIPRIRQKKQGGEALVSGGRRRKLASPGSTRVRELRESTRTKTSCWSCLA
jgi:type IV secretory pathway VirB10-like protein